LAHPLTKAGAPKPSNLIRCASLQPGFDLGRGYPSGKTIETV